MTSRAATRVAIGGAVAWFVATAFWLPQRGHFLADEARLYDGAVFVATSLRPASIGPLVSDTSPRVGLPGGAAFDLLAVPLLWSRSPAAVVRWILLLSSLGVLLLDRALARFGASPLERVLLVALVTCSIWHLRFADRIWNYHLLQLLTPLLLWLSACLAGRASRGFALAFGAAAGVALQLNPSALLPIGAAIVLARPQRWRAAEALKLGAAALVGLGLTFIPFLFAELPTGFSTLRALAADRAARAVPLRNAWTALAAFPMYASQSTPVDPQRQHGILAPLIAFWIAVPLTSIGLLLRSALRPAVLFLVLAVPLSYILWGREFAGHEGYSFAPFPLYLWPSAVVLARLAERGRAGAIAAVIFVTSFAAVGVVLAHREYGRTPRITVARQLALADALLAIGGPVQWIDKSDCADPIIYEVLARRLRGRELELRAGGPAARLAIPCEMESLVVDPR